MSCHCEERSDEAISGRIESPDGDCFASLAMTLRLANMMFIVRSTGKQPEMPGIQVKLSRATPPTVPDATGKTDFFCVGEADATAALRASGWTIVELHDGYYEDG